MVELQEITAIGTLCSNPFWESFYLSIIYSGTPGWKGRISLETGNFVVQNGVFKGYQMIDVLEYR